MSARPFQCTPSAWNRDPVLNSVSWEAEFLFRRVSLECDRYWRMAVDGAQIAHSVRCRALEPSRRYQAWTLPKVARALDELLAAGIVRRLVQAERCWLEVASWLQYVKGASADIVPERADQVDLPLPGELFVLDPPPNGGSPPHSSERTSREEKYKTSTRARCAREEELLASLSAILPPSEMLKNGGLWRNRIRECEQAITIALHDYKNYKQLTPGQRHGREIKNLSAWLTDRHDRAVMELLSREPKRPNASLG